MNNTKIWIVTAAVAALVLVLWLIFGARAEAQTTTSTATSGSSASVSNQSSSQSTSNGGTAYAQGGNVTFNTPGDTRSKTTVKNTGEYTVRSAPPVQAPSMGSGHPCGLGNSIGISLIGGGGAAGITSVDDACLLLQAGVQDAGLRMIAARNPDACVQLRATGRIPSNSTCNAAEQRAAERAAESPRPAANPLASRVTCERDAGGVVTRIRVRGGVDHDAARAYCNG